MVIREFLLIKHKKKRYNDIPGIILSDFVKLVEKKKSFEYKGIHKVTKEFIIMKNKDVRYLNQVSYRLLSFIFYSNLYFAEKLNYLRKENIMIIY